MPEGTHYSNPLFSSMTVSTDHLIELGDGWRLWRSVGLRGTGFPVHQLEILHSPDAVTAMDVMLEAEASHEAHRHAALTLCRQSIAQSRGAARRPWRKAERKLLRTGVPDAIADGPESAEKLRALSDVKRALEKAQGRAAEMVGAARAEILRNLQALCRDPKFREALIWQNRAVMPTCLDKLAKGTNLADNKSRRRAERLVTKYLQRYAAKNDTIGFFGPFGWAVWEEEPVIRVEPGPVLLKQRRVYFEHWAIDALAAKLSLDPGLRPWLSPRVHPACRLDSRGLVVGADRVVQLPPNILLLLQECDGTADASSLATRLVADPGSGFGLRSQVMDALETLCKRRILVWELEVPMGNHPEDLLQGRLRGVRDKPARERLLQPLLTLQSRRASVAAASGDPDALSLAFAKLEATFEELTGEASTRHPGNMYAGRTLLYEDCVRDVEVKLGEAMLKKLREPLSLVLRSSVWFTAAMASKFEAYVESVFRQMVSGTGVVRFDRLLVHNRAAEPVAQRVLAETLRELDKRWREICQPEQGGSLIELRTEEVGARVRELFPDCDVPWPSARYHSPDILVAAQDAAAVRAGRSRWCLEKCTPLTTLWLPEGFPHTMRHPKKWCAGSKPIWCIPELIGD